MDAKLNGRIENSEGAVYECGRGEETTWGVQAAWVDYSGPVANGEQGGLTLVDHATNPRHPTYWHVRAYGLFAANPFGVHDFKGDDRIDESLMIPSGERVAFRYRLVIHPGRGVDKQALVLVDDFQTEDD